MEDKNGEKPQRPTYPPCDTCGKKNHATERFWQGAGAHLRPKRNKENDKTNDDSNEDKNPKSPTIVKHQLQANHFPKSLNQKTDFATTPNK